MVNTKLKCKTMITAVHSEYTFKSWSLTNNDVYRHDECAIVSIVLIVLNNHIISVQLFINISYHIIGRAQRGVWLFNISMLLHLMEGIALISLS